MDRWMARLEPLAGHAAAVRLRVGADTWLEAAQDAMAAGVQLLAFWVTPARPRASASVRAALHWQGRLLVLELEWADPEAPYPSIAGSFPPALRAERAGADLVGLRSDAEDQRRWLKHGAWGVDPPLVAASCPPSSGRDDYPFVRVMGDGVHEIPVGPVHAGIIEPGHFRFSVVGEKVLRLEERLGYVHKGIEWRFTTMAPLDAYRLAARVSGDSAVAFAWAYCQALEGLLGVAVPARALALRAICLELERMQNHLGDLGALGNDAGFAFGLAQFSRLKETLLRAMETAFGQRYLLDAIVPGGVADDPTAARLAPLVEAVRSVCRSAEVLRRIYDEHGGVRDRFLGAGIVEPQLARRLGLVGLAGRASGQAVDLRADAPFAPYDGVTVARVGRDAGDVAARVAVRFDELCESGRLIEELVRTIPLGPTKIGVEPPHGAGLAIGAVEGWRGPVLVALELDDNGAIRRCHPHDPSWQNWPVLEHAVIGNIVPDFPLINKSFNLSYSGHDL
ncbi:MAG: hypothetical protein AB7F89_25805 [Pirellulaceae bacterium]